MRPLKPPTGQWAVVVRGKGASGNERNDTRLFTSKHAAVKFARYRHLEGREAVLFYAHTIPLWEHRPIPPAALDMSAPARRIGSDGESISPTPPARQRPAGDLEAGDDPHPARR